MSNKFEISLRMKTAEQLINMQQNKSLWNEEQLSLIKMEIEKRGLEVFEEPEPWNGEEMESLDLHNPVSEFEKDMSIIAKYEQKETAVSGVKLISQIMSISAVMISFSIYIFLPNSNVYLFSAGVLIGMVSLGLLIGKQYLASVVTSSLALLLILIMAGLELSEFL